MPDAADRHEDDGTAIGSPSPDGRRSPAEELREAVIAGRPVRRGRGEPAAEGNSWGEERQLPAEVLYELLARSEGADRPRGAVLVGLRITGRLNLEAADLQAPLIAHNCHFDEPVNLIAAKAPEISLTACRLRGVAADQLETRGDIDLRNSTLEVVSLLEAHIGGYLELSGATLASGIYPLDLGDGMLRPPESPSEKLTGVALVADGLQVDGGMFCQDGFVAEGEVRVLGAHIVGQMSLNGARLHKGLNGDRLRVERGMVCTGLIADGEVRVLGARIAGQLLFNGAKLHKGVNAEGLWVNGGMVCEKGFVADGEVRVLGAHIAGQLSFNGAKLHKGLNAEGLQVDENMLCQKGFVADGEVRVLGAHIAGQLSFNGAKLHKGLNAEGLQVDRDMLCKKGFVAEGDVRLVGAHIAGQLSFEDATVASKKIAVNLEGARVENDLVLTFAVRPAGELYLTGARAGRLLDSEAKWPVRLRLQGCVYGGVEAIEDEQRGAGRQGGQLTRVRWVLRRGEAPDAQRRLRWIRLAEDGHLDQRPWWRLKRTALVPSNGAGYAPQPYTQLMAFYRQEGRDRDARRVAYERERRRSCQLGLPGKGWNTFLRWTVGYGYRPLRALVLLGALVFAGTLVFSSFHNGGDLRAVKHDHPPFVASIYTLDRLIPVVSFGLRDAFVPSGAAQWWAFAYTVLGWALSVAVIAGLNAAVRRD